MKKLLLASKSPRRISILEEIGVHLDVAPADIDEDAVTAPSVAELTAALAEAKAAEAAKTADPGRLIVAADTLVELDGKKLGKPRDEQDAFVMLSALSSSVHYVHTGIAAAKGGRIITAVETTEVFFRELTRDEIMRYIASGEPMDKAGAYGIQEKGRMFVSRICGDYFNVMGLPVCRLELLLREGFSLSLYDFT